MPKISQHSYDIAVVAVTRDHTSGVSVLKVYRPWARPLISTRYVASLGRPHAWPHTCEKFINITRPSQYTLHSGKS